MGESGLRLSYSLDAVFIIAFISTWTAAAIQDKLAPSVFYKDFLKN